MERAVVAPHQASAWVGFEPTSVPRSKPRRVSMMGVIGWCWATPWIQVGMVWTGTKPLLA